MSAKRHRIPVKHAFEAELLRVAFCQIAPLYVVSSQIKETMKFKQIAASIIEIGLVEPMVVARDSPCHGILDMIRGSNSNRTIV